MPVSFPPLLPPHPGYQAGRWYGTGLVQQGPSPGGLFANLILFAPFWCGAPVTFTQMGCDVTTAAAGAHIQLAVYPMYQGGIPAGSAPIASTPSLDASTLGAKSASGLSIPMTPGLYAAAVNCDNGSVNIQYVNDYLQGWMFGQSTMTATDFQQDMSQAFGAWPAPSSVNAVNFGTAMPYIFFQK